MLRDVVVGRWQFPWELSSACTAEWTLLILDTKVCAVQEVLLRKKTNFIGDSSHRILCLCFCVLHCLKSTHHELFQRRGTRWWHGMTALQQTLPLHPLGIWNAISYRGSSFQWLSLKDHLIYSDTFWRRHVVNLFCDAWGQIGSYLKMRYLVFGPKHARRQSITCPSESCPGLLLWRAPVAEHKQ